MRVVWISKARREVLNPVLIALAAMGAGVSTWAPPAFADATDAASASAAKATSNSISQSLRDVLNGGAPKGVTDLRAMQDHVQRLVDQLKKCTVGVQVDRAWGSGVIISKDGYVLTAAHVADAGRNATDQASFKLADGRSVSGKRLGLFRTLDAGLMKITTPGEYPFAELGNSSAVKEYQWCIAMGHPGGYQLDRGIVLRMGRVLSVGRDAITTECTLVGGDSGGPLFDMDGRVIGINSRISENLTANMHVPVNAYNERGAWDRMLKGDVWGHLPGQNPWLGVGGEDGAKDAKIATVTPKSPAAEHDIKPGDIVFEFDGTPIANFASLKQAVDDCHPNEYIRLRIRRGEEILEKGFRLGRKAE